MADGYKSYGEDNSQYYYYNQQYPPQFYYQYDPQNYNQGVDNSQNFYQGGGNPQPYYYQEIQQNYYSQEPEGRENPHTHGMNERQGNPQNNRGRGGSRGKFPGSRGRGKQQSNAEEHQSMDKRHQPRPHFQEPISGNAERTDSNDSKENFPNSYRNKNYSENTRSRGRGRGQHYNSRQSPDEAPMKEKMIYASSKDAVKKKLQAIKIEVQANDLGDLDEADIEAKLKKI
ncbi:DSTN [Mytilus edulis]|uniref:DSTN n=1 Tax=Mytilus edulis TaxID=6550 RepID=A0A8S3RR89_MYTED|nr:DSTN [Mytilus edulis]